MLDFELLNVMSFLLRQKIVSDRRESSYCECRSVCVRFEEDHTIRRNIRCEFTVQSWKFPEEKFLQGTTDWFEKAYVGFSLQNSILTTDF